MKEASGVECLPSTGYGSSRKAGREVVLPVRRAGLATIFSSGTVVGPP